MKNMNLPMLWKSYWSSILNILNNFINLQITYKLLTHGYRYHKLRKSFGKFFILWRFIWWNIVSRICCGRNLSPGLLRWSSLQTKDGQMRSEFVSSGSKIVKRLRLRKYDPENIERAKGLALKALLQPCTDHCLSIALWLTRRLGLACLNLLRGDRVLTPAPSDC